MAENDSTTSMITEFDAYLEWLRKRPFTPGPWHFRRDTWRDTTIGTSVAIIGGEENGCGTEQFIVGVGSDWGDAQEFAEGNARLIALAPKMFEIVMALAESSDDQKVRQVKLSRSGSGARWQLSSAKRLAEEVIQEVFDLQPKEKSFGGYRSPA